MWFFTWNEKKKNIILNVEMKRKMRKNADKSRQICWYVL